MDLNSIVQQVTKIASHHKSRVAFNQAVEKLLPSAYGKGAFRETYGTQNWVVKLRKESLSEKSRKHFELNDLHASNEEESSNYEELVSYFPYLSTFIAIPRYYVLPNDHDMVIMEKLEVCHDGFQDTLCEYDPLEASQYELLRDTFSDAHSGNIGFIHRGSIREFFMFDFNIEDSIRSLDEAEITAKQLRYKINRRLKKKN